MTNNIIVKYGDDQTGVYVIDNFILSASVIQETRKIATELPASTMDLELDVKDWPDFEFVVKKPIYVYRDDTVVQKTFITDAKKTTQYRWTIKSTDYIGMMDYLTYDGKYYYQQKFEKVIEDIFYNTNIPYIIDPYAKDILVSGNVSAGTVRSALQEICFSFGLCATTANCDGVFVRRLSDEISQTIGRERIMKGISFEKKETITKLSIGYSNVITIDESKTVTQAFSPDFIRENLGKWVTIELEEPGEFQSSNVVGNFYRFYTAGGNEGQLPLFTEFTSTPNNVNAKLISSLRPAIEEGINTLGDGWLAFYVYPYTSAEGGVLVKDNPVETDFPFVNEVALKSLGTMTSENAQVALDRIFDNLTIGLKIRAKIIDGRNYLLYGSFKFGSNTYGYDYQQPVNIGEMVNIETENNGLQTGFVQKASYKLYGSTKIVKDCEIV